MIFLYVPNIHCMIFLLYFQVGQVVTTETGAPVKFAGKTQMIVESYQVV